MKKFAINLLIFSFVISALTGVVKAAVGENSLQPQNMSIPIVTVKPVLPQKPPAPGETFELILELTIAPGYHINSEKPEDPLLVPTSVEFKKDPAWQVKAIIFPEAKKKKFSFSDKVLSVYDGQLKLKVKIELADDLCGSELQIEGQIRYQACNDQACLRPSSVPFKVKVPISS